MGGFLHTMIRVGNLERSVDFYTRLLGMKELRRRDVPEGKYTLAFLGYGDGNASGGGEIELTYNYGITLSERHTPRLKKIWACRCGAKNCTGTMLQPKR